VKEIKKSRKESAFNSPVQPKHTYSESQYIFSPSSATNPINEVELPQTFKEFNQHQNKKQKLMHNVVTEELNSDLRPFNKIPESKASNFTNAIFLKNTPQFNGTYLTESLEDNAPFAFETDSLFSPQIFEEKNKVNVRKRSYQDEQNNYDKPHENEKSARRLIELQIENERLELKLKEKDILITTLQKATRFLERRYLDLKAQTTK